MRKLKILIVSASFFPKISPRSFRATELSKEFAKQGHKVTVLTHKGNYDYTNFLKDHKITIRDFVFGKYHEISRKNSILKSLHFISKKFFMFPEIQYSWLIKNALKEHERYDLLISIAMPYPVHWGVAFAKKHNPNLCLVWVADCGDPFMGHTETKFKPPAYFKYIEKWFCKQPDYITIPVKESLNAYPYACNKKIEIIPQGFDFSGVKENSFKKNPIPVFAYTGALNKGFRSPVKLLNHLSKLTHIDFKFIVYTNNIKIIKPFAKALGEKLEIREYIPRHKLLSEMEKMDFLVNIENKQNIQVPSKLIDYALTAKPILSVHPVDYEPKKVLDFLAGDYSAQLKIENLEQYNIKRVTKKFISLFEKACNIYQTE